MNGAHPTYDMLWAHATGRATEGMSLIVAAHLTYCPVCRVRLGAMEAVGGAVLAEDLADHPAGPDLDATLARLDADETGSEAIKVGPAPEAAILPRPIAEAAGADVATIPWRFLLPGVAEYAMSSADDEKVSLLRVRPGVGIPRHTHDSIEATLVLHGELIDGDAVYRTGDLAVATDADDHRPRAGSEADCICLAVLTGGLRFTGTFGRALNYFGE